MNSAVSASRIKIELEKVIRNSISFSLLLEFAFAL